MRNKKFWLEDLKDDEKLVFGVKTGTWILLGKSCNDDYLFQNNDESISKLVAISTRAMLWNPVMFVTHVH